MPLFLFVIDDDDEELPHWRGVQAAKKILEDEREAFNDDTLNLDNVQQLNCFDFVLTDAEREQVQTWLSEVWKKAGLADQNNIVATLKISSSSTTTTTIGKTSKSASRKSPPAHAPVAAQSMDNNVADLFA